MSRRVMKTTATATNTFLYDGWNLLAEVRDQSSEVSANYYVWGLDISQSLQGAGGILADFRPPTSDLHFYHYDGNGNVSSVTDSNSAITARYEYDPFGRVLLADGAYTPRFQFSSKEYDQATGLNYYGYRFYSPELGRWINRDPIEELGGENLYGYVVNDPLNAFDLLGLSSLGKQCPDGWKPCAKEGHVPGSNGCGPEGWKNRLVPDMPFWMIDFTESCNAHDRCYDTCHENGAAAKRHCDDEFLSDMQLQCFRRWGIIDGGPGSGLSRWRWQRCRELAAIYHGAVAAAGASAFNAAQDNACDCCCGDQRQ